MSYGEWKEAYHQFCQESDTLDKSDWANVRMGLIQAYNDLITERDMLIPDDFRDMLLSIERPVDAFVASVISDFIREYDWSTVKNPLLKAELYREVGQFDQSMEILRSINRVELDEYEQGIYDDIKIRVEQKDVNVFRIKSVQERAKEEMIERGRMMAMERMRWLEEQEKDPRLKVCKNGHCFKNLEHECRWCGEQEVVGRVEEDTPRIDVVLFVGQRDGQWVMTTDPDIEGKSKRIRKITVDIVGGYKRYYHLDGQNPDPFCHNTIRLDDKSFFGEELIEKCDRLIDENLEEVPLGIPVIIPPDEDVDERKLEQDTENEKGGLKDCNSDVKAGIKRNKKWIAVFAVSSTVLICVGMPFLFTEKPMVGMVALVGIYLGGMAMFLSLKNKDLRKKTKQ